MSPVHVKVGGVWKQASSVYTKVGGVWNTATDMPVRVGGAWKSGILAPPDAHVLIASQTVGAGGAASVTFSNIPQTYKHLQIRGIFIATNGANGTYAQMRFNNDAGSNYAFHYLSGAGDQARSGAFTSQNNLQFGPFSSMSVTGWPTAIVSDVLDYASQSKNKTVKAIVGADYNGGGAVDLRSGPWISTASVTSLTIMAMSQGVASNFGQYSTFALYGIAG